MVGGTDRHNQIWLGRLLSLHKVYTIATAQGVNPGPWTRVVTPPPTTRIASSVVDATLGSPGVNHLIIVISSMIVKDQL